MDKSKFAFRICFHRKDRTKFAQNGETIDDEKMNDDISDAIEAKKGTSLFNLRLHSLVLII